MNIRLWTIQPLTIWEQLKKNGIFHCDANLAKCMQECEVLLSDEVGWHFVLNDSYMPSAQNQKEFDRKWESYEYLSEEEKRMAKEKSWEAIFTVSPPHYDEWNQTGRYIQAIFWELNLEQVRDVRYFGK